VLVKWQALGPVGATSGDGNESCNADAYFPCPGNAFAVNSMSMTLEANYPSRPYRDIRRTLNGSGNR